jgi:hypothetical protein
MSCSSLSVKNLSHTSVSFPLPILFLSWICWIFHLYPGSCPVTPCSYSLVRVHLVPIIPLPSALLDLPANTCFSLLDCSLSTLLSSASNLVAFSAITLSLALSSGAFLHQFRYLSQPNSTSTQVGSDKVISRTTTTPPHQPPPGKLLSHF